MKIEFTQYRTLDEISRTVKPGETLQSPDVPDRLMQAYVRNGIALDISPAPVSHPPAPTEAAPQEVATNAG
jgi:hypothetical protein